MCPSYHSSSSTACASHLNSRKDRLPGSALSRLSGPSYIARRLTQAFLLNNGCGLTRKTKNALDCVCIRGLYSEQPNHLPRISVAAFIPFGIGCQGKSSFDSPSFAASFPARMKDTDINVTRAVIVNGDGTHPVHVRCYPWSWP